MVEIFYRIMPKNRFFQTNLTLIENELRPRNAVSFTHDLDLPRIKDLRRHSSAERPTYTSLLAKAITLAPSKYPYAKQRIVERPFFARWWPVHLLEDAAPLLQAGEAPAPTSAA